MCIAGQGQACRWGGDCGKGARAGSGGNGKGAEDVDGGSIAQDWQDGSLGKRNCTV